MPREPSITAYSTRISLVSCIELTVLNLSKSDYPERLPQLSQVTVTLRAAVETSRMPASVRVRVDLTIMSPSTTSLRI